METLESHNSKQMTVNEQIAFKTSIFFKSILGWKKREPELEGTRTGANWNQSEPELTETESNQTEPWASWIRLFIIIEVNGDHL